MTATSTPSRQKREWISSSLQSPSQVPSLSAFANFLFLEPSCVLSGNMASSATGSVTVRTKKKLAGSQVDVTAVVARDTEGKTVKKVHRSLRSGLGFEHTTEVFLIGDCSLSYKTIKSQDRQVTFTQCNALSHSAAKSRGPLLRFTTMSSIGFSVYVCLPVCLSVFASMSGFGTHISTIN
ncbi:hypothetical protein PoB_006056600 [Plakobranchus ocellatus]|uniref:Uncharacterized protein n=1 Tax=Plakobranchus ocellatus TaxID=259542 RepID=A0AAV4CQB0_9GAST|nr:hypothetical protein PoB_006056600 [Plakobranchus ocellatus]